MIYQDDRLYLARRHAQSNARVRKSEDVPKIVQNNFTPVHELLELTFTQASRFLLSSTQAIPTSSTKS